MLRKKQIKKKHLDQDLLDHIRHLKEEMDQLEGILRNSVDPSEKGLYDLAVKRAKYYYMLKEARHRHIHHSSSCSISLRP
ncbi:uncharacterized protein DUF2508 [Melghiribacillus thermohalophilus]|uniref:Uncharacterized protein DUF2508 n=1 Tax=Melghiribacillus thermohalophilus TaxID=1324956 RepID=A0A4R3N853_9BACI|nr:YaaL family protein [Melghiribacillus thermohalophilus]TCT24661.1 uncharacterized protein DUF2508 [Melghiribacillus thermohalophilus]